MLEWLFARQRFGIKPGLERTRALLAALHNPQEHFASVLVGGTNGKGSTVATLATILSASGRRTALFTSPHLTHFAERFVVNGEPLPEGEVLAALAEVKPQAEVLEATFFEIVTALGCLLFARAHTDIAVMEVGLGGRFDSTNVLDPILSIITGVALDHTRILGETIGEIAREKAGIMRAGKPCLTGATAEVLEVLQAEAERVGAELWTVSEKKKEERRKKKEGDASPLTPYTSRIVNLQSRDFEGITFDLESPLGNLRLASPLIGVHQARNVALAALAAQHLAVNEDAIRFGVQGTKWPGRLEPIRYRERIFLLDGAHNPEAAEALARAVNDFALDKSLLIFGMSSDKDISGIAGPLHKIASQVILTQARLSPRAANPQDLQAFWRVPTILAESLADAVDLAVKTTAPGDLIVVAGSLYLIGEVRPLLLGEKLEELERWQ